MFISFECFIVLPEDRREIDLFLIVGKFDEKILFMQIKVKMKSKLNWNLSINGIATSWVDSTVRVWRILSRFTFHVSVFLRRRFYFEKKARSK